MMTKYQIGRIMIVGLSILGITVTSLLPAQTLSPVVAQTSAPIGDRTKAAVSLPPVLFQPMAADDVASALCKVATSSPLNGTIEIAGPEVFRFDELIRKRISVLNDSREVVADPHAQYFGTYLSERSIVPDDTAQLGETRFEDWLSLPTNRVPPASHQPATAASTSPVALKENEFRVSDVPPGSALLVGDVVVFNIAGSFCATQEKCTHRQGPLSKGTLDGSTVTCPLHGSQFNVCTGEALRGPASEPLKTYRVGVDGEIGRIDIGKWSIASQRPLGDG